MPNCSLKHCTLFYVSFNSRNQRQSKTRIWWIFRLELFQSKLELSPKFGLVWRLRTFKRNVWKFWFYYFANFWNYVHPFLWHFFLQDSSDYPIYITWTSLGNWHKFSCGLYRYWYHWKLHHHWFYWLQSICCIPFCFNWRSFHCISSISYCCFGQNSSQQKSIKICKKTSWRGFQTWPTSNGRAEIKIFFALLTYLNACSSLRFARNLVKWDTFLIFNTVNQTVCLSICSFLKDVKWIFAAAVLVQKSQLWRLNLFANGILLCHCPFKLNGKFTESDSSADL